MTANVYCRYVKGGKWWRKMYNKKIPMETRTIDEIISQLNSFEARTNGTGIWSAIPGVQALTSITRKTNRGLLNIPNRNLSEVDFHPDSGILVKAFVNSVTGEIKIFPAKFLGYPEIDI